MEILYLQMEILHPLYSLTMFNYKLNTIEEDEYTIMCWESFY